MFVVESRGILLNKTSKVLYFSDNSTWSLVDAQGLGPSARDKVCSVVIGNNVYIFGGFGPQGTEEEEVSLQWVLSFNQTLLED